MKSILFVFDFWTRWTHVWKCEWATSKKYNKVEKGDNCKGRLLKNAKAFFLEERRTQIVNRR